MPSATPKVTAPAIAPLPYPLEEEKTRKQNLLETRPRSRSMLTKLTSKNRLTLPKAVVASVEVTEYFDVTVENGRIILTPVRIQHAQAVRDKLDQLGITEQDIDDAMTWARR